MKPLFEGSEGLEDAEIRELLLRLSDDHRHP